MQHLVIGQLTPEETTTWTNTRHVVHTENKKMILYNNVEVSIFKRKFWQSGGEKKRHTK